MPVKAKRKPVSKSSRKPVRKVAPSAAGYGQASASPPGGQDPSKRVSFDPDDEVPPSQINDTLLSEIGTVGLKHWGGIVDEEWHKRLRGRYGALAFREMVDNDPVAGTGQWLLELLAKKADVKVESADDSGAAREWADFTEECRNDMSHDWSSFMTDAMSHTWAGWALHELVYKYRRGLTGVDATSSAYNDGRIGWRKLPIRSQDTHFKWLLDDEDGLVGWVQQDRRGHINTIPIERALLFRHRPWRNNPEGRSMFRTSWISYYYAKRWRENEAVGGERDLTGNPVMEVPPAYLDENAPDEVKAMAKYLKNLIIQIGSGAARMGGIIPSETDKAGPTGFKLRLMGSGGQKQYDSDKIITRYETRIAIALLMEFVMLGMDQVGSYALDTGKRTFFSIAVQSILDEVAKVFNNYAIPRLMRINGAPRELWPRLTFTNVVAPDLSQLAQILTAGFTTGLLETTDDDESKAWFRRMVGMPKPPEQKLPALR